MYGLGTGIVTSNFLSFQQQRIRYEQFVFLSWSEVMYFTFFLLVDLFENILSYSRARKKTLSISV